MIKLLILDFDGATGDTKNVIISMAFLWENHVLI